MLVWWLLGVTGDCQHEGAPRQTESVSSRCPTGRPGQGAASRRRLLQSTAKDRHRLSRCISTEWRVPVNSNGAAYALVMGECRLRPISTPRIFGMRVASATSKVPMASPFAMKVNVPVPSAPWAKVTPAVIRPVGRRAAQRPTASAPSTLYARHNAPP